MSEQSEKFEISEHCINHFTELLDALQEAIDESRKSLKEGTTFNKFITLNWLSTIAAASKEAKKSRDMLRFGVLIGQNLIEQCESSKTYLAEEGCVNNCISYSNQPSSLREKESATELPKELDELFYKIKQEILSRGEGEHHVIIEKTRKSKKSDEPKETPDFVKEMLDKIASGELS